MTDTMSAASPLPQVEIKTSLAPGKKGPVGLAPRTDYSRVNSGVPATPDAGASEQKAMAPQGAEMLPKVASEGSMGQMAARPTINDLVKAAMAGTARSVDISREAARQATNMGEKTASAPPVEASTDFEQAEKLASALEYVASELRKEGAQLGGPYNLKENKVEPGKGPGALHSEAAQAEGHFPFQPGNQGSAHTKVPTHSSEQKTTPSGPTTQLSNNMGNPAGFHQHQQTSMVNQKGTKVAAEKCSKCGNEPCTCSEKKGAASSILATWTKMAKENEELEAKETAGMEEAKKGLAKAEAAHEKEASSLVDSLRSHINKVAEDAINPAKISAGAAVPPDIREAGQPGGVQAAGGQPSLVGSNQAAIDYKKSQAKAEPKRDLAAYVKEPALSGSTDKTLSMAFSHTGEAGTKFAGAMNKTAAARALLQKIAAEAEEKKKDEKKEKDSNMPGMC